ncbi:unnamed protein product, partial [marine sediment metagenome]
YFNPTGPEWVRVNFEVYVDGRLRAQSGFIGPKDPARLVVVKGLAGAKELRLRTRLAKMTASTMMSAWGNARLYR